MEQGQDPLFVRADTISSGLRVMISRKQGDRFYDVHNISLSLEELAELVDELDLLVEARRPELSLRRRTQEDVLEQFRAMIAASREAEHNEPAGPQPLYPPKD